MSVVLCTDDVPEGERLDFLHEMMCQAFVPLAVTPATPERVSMTVNAHQVAYLGVSQAVGTDLSFRRTRRLADHTGGDHVLVQVGTAGVVAGAQDGRQVLLGPGDIALFDATRPYEVHLSDDYRATVLVVPRHVLGVSDVELGRITATSIRSDEGLAGLVYPFLSQLADRAGTVDQASGQRLAAGAVSLLEALIAERVTDTRCEPETAGAVMLLRIRTFIGQHLSDPDLSPETIAQAHHISVRYLHKLFQGEQTTVTRWLLQRRLEQCRLDLGRPGQSASTVAAIAHRWGFASHAHFSRCFRTAYGLSPRQWRERATRSRGQDQ